MNSPISRDLSNVNAAEAEYATTIAAEEEEEIGPIDEEENADGEDRSLFEFVRIPCAKPLSQFWIQCISSSFLTNQDIRRHSLCEARD